MYSPRNFIYVMGSHLKFGNFLNKINFILISDINFRSNMSREGFPGGCNPADVLYKLAHNRGIKPPVFEMVILSGGV